MFYNFAGFVVKMFLMIFGGIKVYDKEKLPEKGGYVIACTHTGWVDILWLGVAILPRQIHFMAKKELFENKFVNKLITALNAFPVDRENPGPSAIKIPRKLLKEGKIIGIFPSGTRTTEEVPLKRGAVTIAAYGKAPIIPAAYVGPNDFKDLFKFRKAKLIFGDPIHLPEDQSRKEAMDTMMTELNEKMYALQRQLKDK